MATSRSLRQSTSRQQADALDRGQTNPDPDVETKRLEDEVDEANRTIPDPTEWRRVIRSRRCVDE